MEFGCLLDKIGNMVYRRCMARNIEALTQEAVGLSPAQRLNLANRLLASVEDSSGNSADEAWTQVIRERRARYEAGEAITYSVEETFAELDRRLKPRGKK
jgi:hypothetical protein